VVLEQPAAGTVTVRTSRIPLFFRVVTMISEEQSGEDEVAAADTVLVLVTAIEEVRPSDVVVLEVPSTARGEVSPVDVVVLEDGAGQPCVVATKLNVVPSQAVVPKAT
jgi:hypothetical protein